MTGGPAPRSRYRHAYQELEDFSQFDAVTKFNAQVDHVERLPDLLRQAFRDATTGAPGPVHLRDAAATTAEIIEAEADLDLSSKTASSRCRRSVPRRTRTHVQGMRSRCSTQAERPVIVAGRRRGLVRRAGRSGRARREALHPGRDLAQREGGDTRHASADGRRAAAPIRAPAPTTRVAEADLVFFIGSHTGGQVTTQLEDAEAGASPVIQLDIDPAELGRNYPNVVLACSATRKATLRQHARAGGHRRRRETRAMARAACRRLSPSGAAGGEPMRNSDAVPMRPSASAARSPSALPADARRGVRHRPLRHLDRRHDRIHAAGPASHPLRRLARLGLPRRARA